MSLVNEALLSVHYRHEAAGKTGLHLKDEEYLIDLTTDVPLVDRSLSSVRRYTGHERAKFNGEIM